MKTYCNPLPVEDMPSGYRDDVRVPKEQSGINDYRSMGDPSVVYHDGKWYMYPSYKLAYVSEDFVNWKKIDIGVDNVNYSPAIVEFRGKWYLSGHSRPEVYCADSPEGPFKLCGMLTDTKGNHMKVPDGCYLADGDRLYFYWHEGSSDKDICGERDVEYYTSTVGAELDPDKPWMLITEPVVINEFDKTKQWQCTGEYNQNRRMGWIEGQWAFKIGNRYYLMYSGCGTEYSGYVNAVVYSDQGPLSGFRPQKNHNPLAESRYGVVKGAGHGSIVKGPNDTLWMFYSSVFGFNHKFERRIGMDPVGVDENGEIFCPGITETPQYAPGVLNHPEEGNSAGLLPLTFNVWPCATSFKEGREPIYASDESVLTWWQPAEDDKQPCITYTVGRNETFYNVSSIRLLWRDIGMDTENGINPGPFRYVVEYASDTKQTNWHTLVDASENDRDLVVDYREFDTVRTCAVRLKILGAPKGITPGLVNLTVFGLCDTVL
ncbi:MAG: family 43 glycosylhydrolase [Clostridia bacterium]|nr:family 43 glycosylhydrolase [Clostridia bacterium]